MARSWLALAVMVAACGAPVGPSTDEVMVSMVRQGVGDNTVVAITLENHGDREIVNNCQAIFLERATENGWVMARGPSCVQPVPPPSVVLQPGESRTVTLEQPSPGWRYRPVAVIRFSGESTEHVITGSEESW